MYIHYRLRDPSLNCFSSVFHLDFSWFSQKGSGMTRLYPSHSLVQASNGWHQHFNHSRIMQEQFINVTTKGNSTISFPIVCHNLNSQSSGIFYGDNPLSHSFSVVIFNLAFINLITHFIGVLLKPLRQPFIISQMLVSFLLLHLSDSYHSINNISNLLKI